MTPPMMPSPNPFTAAPPLWQKSTCRYFPVGFGAAFICLLPWLVTGMRLPMQDLWAVDILPENMPRALLPFSQYQLPLILAMIIFGAGLACRAVRAAPTDVWSLGALPVATGALGPAHGLRSGPERWSCTVCKTACSP